MFFMYFLVTLPVSGIGGSPDQRSRKSTFSNISSAARKCFGGLTDCYALLPINKKRLSDSDLSLSKHFVSGVKTLLALQTLEVRFPRFSQGRSIVICANID